MNYVGVAETLGITASAQAAGLAADNLLCAVYFAFIYFLARTIPGDPVPGRLLCALEACAVVLLHRLVQVCKVSGTSLNAAQGAWPAWHKQQNLLHYSGPRSLWMRGPSPSRCPVLCAMSAHKLRQRWGPQTQVRAVLMTESQSKDLGSPSAGGP